MDNLILNDFIMTCESLMINEDEIALEGLNIKQRLTDLKNWFVKVCEEFWNKITKFFNNLKDKLKNKKDTTKEKSFKEEYNELLVAYNVLKQSNVKTVDDYEKLKTQNTGMKNINEKLADKHASATIIISQMKKNNTTLDQERKKIQEDYDNMKDDASIGAGVQTAARSVSLIHNTLNSISSDLDTMIWIVKKGYKENSNKGIDTVNDKMIKNIDDISSIIDNYQKEGPSYIYSYFRGALQNMRYEFLVNRGKVVEYHLKNMREYEKELNKIIDTTIAFSEKGESTGNIVHINTVLGSITKVQNILIKILAL